MKVFFDTIGCRLNQSEIEKMAAQARLNGHEVVAQVAQADVVIVNTCAVTLAASSDSRMKIRQAARAGARVIATGCYATVSPAEVRSLPGVSENIPNTEKDELIQKLLGQVAEGDERSEKARIPLPGRQHRTRAFIKVQDGCDNFCSFCITRIARGRSRSQPKQEIYLDIESALKGGVKEIVLTGVNLGAWGRDSGNGESLSVLIKNILIDFSPNRLRLSSLEPWDIDDDFLQILKMPGFCRHLHLPLQSGSQAILKRMGRRNTAQDFRELVNKIKDTVPEIALTSDIMVGFPGETEDEFAESLEFVREMRFAGGHVFNFSLRPDTPAEHLPNPIPAAIRKARSAKMREVVEAGRRDYQAEFLGGIEQVLWERSKKTGSRWQVDGLTDTYIRVRACAERDLRNEISEVRLTESVDTCMNGIIQ